MSSGSIRAVWLVCAIFLATTAGRAQAGPVADCNQNGVPDASDLLSPDFGDCNNNGVLDVCDVDPADPDGNTLVSIDLNNNHRPDECDLGGRLVGPGVEINPRTGHATKLPPPPGVALQDDPQWIAFDPDGTLYGLRDRRLYTINRDNWTTMDVAYLDDDVGSPTFAPDGTLYALYKSVPSRFGLTVELATVNVQTGAVTSLGFITLKKPYFTAAAIAFRTDAKLHAIYEDPYFDNILLAEIDLATLIATPIEYYPAAHWGSYPEGLAFDANGSPHISVTNYHTELGSNTYASITEVFAPFLHGPRSIAFGPDETFYAVADGGLFDLRQGEYRVGRFSFGDYAANGSVLYSAGTVLSQIDVNTGVTRPLGGWYPGYDNPTVHELTFCSTVFGVAEESGTYWLVEFGAAPLEICYIDDLDVVVGLICGEVDDDVYALRRSTNQILRISILDAYDAHSIPISTLELPVYDLARGSGNTVYGVDGTQLMSVDILTGDVTPIGPLSIWITTLTYVAATVDPSSAAPCLQGPGNWAFGECTTYDFNGDGFVDLRDVSGLWLIDQR